MRQHHKGIMKARIDAVAGRLAYQATLGAAWLVGRFKALKVHSMTDRECELADVPYGSTEPHVYCMKDSSARLWCVGLWADADEAGDRCLTLTLLGWRGEVHYEERRNALHAL